MRGHQPIVAMRQRGRRPVLVNVGTDPDHAHMWRVWPELNPAQAFVQIDPNDVAAALDLRFLTALTVSVLGSDPDRVEAIAQACRDHHADRVIAVCTRPEPWFDVVSINDSNGLLTWPN